MIIDWAHTWPSVAAVFFTSMVEFVEAFTVVLAVGTVRGWRGALAGTAAAILALLQLVALLGPALTRIPLGAIQIWVGALLLLMRWLRKTISRAAGVIALHDEAAIFAAESESLRVSDADGR